MMVLKRCYTQLNLIKENDQNCKKIVLQKNIQTIVILFFSTIESSSVQCSLQLDECY